MKKYRIDRDSINKKLNKWWQHLAYKMRSTIIDADNVAGGVEFDENIV
jgi:hypothetical protein